MVFQGQLMIKCTRDDRFAALIWRQQLSELLLKSVMLAATRRPGLLIPASVMCTEKSPCATLCVLSAVWPGCDPEECWRRNNCVFSSLKIRVSLKSPLISFWLFAQIPVTTCYAFPAYTNTFLLFVVHHVLQCWEGMSQERTGPIYAWRTNRSTLEYVVRPRLLLNESYHMNIECMLSSECF